MVNIKQELSSQRTSKNHFSDNSTIAHLRRFVTCKEHNAKYENLRRPGPFLAWVQVVINWTGIFGSWAFLLSIHSAWLVVLTLIVVGSRQRALNNILHDASHNNLFRTKRLNSVFSSVFAALPLGDSYNLYRSSHMLHHAHLGEAQNDPDYLCPPQIKSGPLFLQAWKFYSSYIFNMDEWISSITGSWKHLNSCQRRAVLAWWFVTLGTMSLLTGILSTTIFIVLWLVSRSTTYHMIRVFAEISDHTGLVPGSITKYTRNMPRSLWNMLLHPFGDNYHLLHHLFPNVPTIRLHRLHKILLNEPSYTRLQLIDGYFTGNFPIIKSWVESNRLLEVSYDANTR